DRASCSSQQTDIGESACLRVGVKGGPRGRRPARSHRICAADGCRISRSSQHLNTRSERDGEPGMGIVRFALRFPYTFYGMAALILFLGVSAIAVMPIDIFPVINIPVVTVIWQYTGLSTPEMEQRVTTYSQYAISTSVSGIKNMEAQTLN